VLPGFLFFSPESGGWWIYISVMDKATVAENKIERLCDKVGCSEDGVLWIKQALDPFNDEDRRKVGFPDVITGKSIVQKIPFAATYTVGAAAEDVHIYLDSVDCPEFVYNNTNYIADAITVRSNFLADAVSGIGAARVGGLCLRKGPVGTDLDITTSFNLGGPLGPTGLDPVYLAGGSARVLSKGFEVVNATPVLTVGGSVRCYRATGVVPYDQTEVITMRQVATPTTTALTLEGRRTQQVPLNVGEVELYTDHTFWAAKEGCMVVAIPSAQTNEPTSDTFSFINAGSLASTPAKSYINAFSGATFPKTTNTAAGQMFSPFFMCGAYFTGLPANSVLDIRGFYYVERFVNSTQKDLVILANPSPHYDPIALEIMSKSAMKLPCGTRVKNNADGDWIKSVADILGVFGVPGMPLVRAGVDAYNGAKAVYDNWNSPPQSQIKMGKTLKQGGVKPSKAQRQQNLNAKNAAKGKNSRSKTFVGPIRPGDNRSAVKKAQKASRAGLASGGSI